MPLNPVEVAREMAKGLSAVCATCERFWAARDRQMDKCLALTGCCSPLGGGTFHEYQGPLTVESFKLFCFVCGSASSHAVRVRSSLRVIGVCREHLDLFRQLAPVGKPTPEVTVAGSDQPVSKLLVVPPKSLFAAIAETEAEFAAEDR